MAEPCTHLKYHPITRMVYADVSLGTSKIRQLTLLIKIQCVLCKRMLIFKGNDIGYATSHPMLSPDGYELRAPLEFPDDVDATPDPEEPPPIGTLQ